MKNILFGILILIVTLSFTIENGKLSGVVTYKDAYVLTNQTDDGGEVYAISEADAKSAKYGDVAKVVGQFLMSKSYYSQTVFNTIDPARIKVMQDSFDTVSNFTSKYLSRFKKLSTVVRASVNGKGNYTLNLKPGKNYILFISGKVKSDNTAESKGNIAMNVADIKSSGETLLDANFMVHENFLMMLLTGRWLQGC